MSIEYVPTLTLTGLTGHVSLVKTANICMKKIHFYFFFMINGHIWQIDFQTAMFNTKKIEQNIGNKEMLDSVGPCFVI